MDPTTRNKLQVNTRLMEAAGTVSEAEAAAAAMQRMILKHNLEAADLENLGEQEHELYESVFIRVAPDRKPGIQWRLNLLYVLAEYSFCAFIRYGVHGATGVIVGQPSNIEAVRVMFQATVDTVERLGDSEWYSFRNDEWKWMHAGRPTAMAWKNSFRIGFAYGVKLKMYQERKEMVALESKVSALVVLKGTEIESAIEENVGTITTHKGSSPTSKSGFERGVEKGLSHELQNRLDA